MNVELKKETIIVKEKPLYEFMKRAFDIVASLIGIIFSILPGLFVSIAIVIDSKGPIIYKQDRLGINGKSFEMYKFRSMRIDAEKDGMQWAKKDDDRCTKVGTFIRKCRLDELPQFYNILKGDMSFVGPRPEREYFYNEFEKYIPHFRQRLLVKPGLTGLAQVNGGYDLLPEEKIVYDLEYINNRSFKIDMLCILKTFKLIFTHDGAR